jgi:4-aminobutyrate aminotransferase-like enzyme
MANAGQRGNVIKIRPPLIFEQSHAELLLEALTETVEEIHAGA